MRNLRRPIARILLVLAVLMTVQFAVEAWAIVAGRDFSRCVRSCNATRKVCDDYCSIDCKALYSTKPERDACIAACKAICLQESDECKMICQQIKNPPSPECP